MIGKKIFDRLEQSNKTGQWLADKLGVTNQYVSNLRNRTNITTDTLEKISTALNVPMTYWFEPKSNETQMLNEPADDEYHGQNLVQKIYEQTTEILQKVDALKKP